MIKENSVNLDDLPDAELDELSKNMGVQINDIAKDASQRMNAILTQYGLTVELSVSFRPTTKE
jgi:hypothetical protein